MAEPLTFAQGAQAAGGLWFVKELFAFLLKLRKSDQQFEQKRQHAKKQACPTDENWKSFCIEKFDTILGRLNEIDTNQKILEVRFEHLEEKIKGA